MANIKITADSVCDLTPEIIKENDLTLFPLVVNLGEESVFDGPGIADKIYAFVDKTKTTPKTAARSVAEYHAFFQQHLPAGGSLIHFNISSEISSSYQNAVAAAQDLPGVYVIDSRSLSTGVGVLIMQAVKLRAQGLPAAKIAAQITANTAKVQCSFIVKDLTYLHRGGRCSSTAKLFAVALRLKPQIVMKNGKMLAGKKFMGSYEGCVKKYVATTLETYNNPDLDCCFITHTKMDNPQIVAAIRAQILAKYPFKQIIETTAGGTITAHSGPNTIGILYGLQ